MRAASVAASLTTLALLAPLAHAEPSDYSNPNTATALAATWSAVSIGALVLGAKMRNGGDTPILVIGAASALAMPSAGHWWADSEPKLTAGFGLRFLGLTIAGIGFGSAYDRNCTDNGSACKGPIHDGTSDGLVIAGAALVGAGMLWDIATAGGEAERHNARSTRHHLGIAPSAMPTASGRSAPGLAVGGAF